MRRVCYFLSGVSVGDRDTANARSFGGLYALGRIFNNDAICGVDAQGLHTSQVTFGIRFAMFYIFGGNHNRKVIGKIKGPQGYFGF